MSKTKNIYNTIRSAKFILKPNSKQKEMLESFFGLSRAIYNISLYNIKNSKFGISSLVKGIFAINYPFIKYYKEL